MRAVEQPWTENQVAALRRLWMRTVLSASEIAVKHHAEVGNRTRNSIIGKVHRLQLPMRCPENSHSVAKRIHGIRSDRPIMDDNWRSLD